MARKFNDVASILIPKGKNIKAEQDFFKVLSEQCYIKFGQDCRFKKGDIINIDTKGTRIDRLNMMIDDGKMSADHGEKLIGYAEKIPEFVKAVLVQKVED
jgi:hypothetical protein